MNSCYSIPFSTFTSAELSSRLLSRRPEPSQDEGDKTLSILDSIVELEFDVAAGLPFGAVMVRTPSALIVDVTFSGVTPDGRVNFCSNTRVLVPPGSLTSCLKPKSRSNQNQ